MVNRLITGFCTLFFAFTLNAQETTSQFVRSDDEMKAPAVDPTDFDVIFHQDLEDTPLGVYTRDQWEEDWNNPPWANGIYNGDKTIINDFNKGGRITRAMQWTFPEGSFGAHSSHGYQWQTPLDGDYEELYLSYSIMFKPGFEPVLGGKIPGLQGSPRHSGPPGWEEGFGGSLMFKQGPNPVFYIYHHDQPGNYGDTKGWAYTFDVSTDIWYDITFRVVMNTATATSEGGPDGLNDGLMEGFVNGELVGRWNDIRLRNLANVGIDVLRVQAFFGGGSSSWATIRDEWMLVDNFFVWRYSDSYLAENPDTKTGRNANAWRANIDTPLDADFSGGVVDPDPDPDPNDTQPPTVPTGLMATDSTDRSVRITWNASTDNTGVTGYRVYLNDLVHGATGETQYNVTPLDAGIEYSFAVSAFDAADNESPKSGSISAYTMNEDTEAPTVPTNITVNRVTGYSIEFSWDPSQDNVGVQKYSIYIDDSWAGDQPSNSYTAFGLQPDTEYSIAVRAFDAAGNFSPLSESITQRTGAPDSEAPTVPSGLTAVEVTEKTISLQWEPSTDNVGVSEYQVYVNNEVRERSSSTRETIAQLQPGLDYDISVSATDEAGNESARSEEITVTTVNEDVTTEPTLPTISILSIQDKTISPSAVTEMRSLGFTELKNYGLEISQTSNPGIDPIVLKGTSTSEVVNSGRSRSGLQVLYNFSEGSGNQVQDRSGNNPPLNLTIDREGIATEWLPGQGLRIYGNSILEYEGAPDRLVSALSSTNEITLEAWVKQEELNQAGPARILTLSEGNSARAATLGHEGNRTFFNYVSRLTTSETDLNGVPQLETSMDFFSESLHHVVYTRASNGVEKLYVNGFELASGNRTGDFSTWTDDYTLAVANEITGERPSERSMRLL